MNLEPRLQRKDILEILSQRLTEERTQQYPRLQDLIDKSNIPGSSIYNYQKKITLPTATKLRNLAVALNCSTDYLVGLTDEK